MQPLLNRVRRGVSILFYSTTFRRFFHTFWLNYLAGIYYNYDSSTNKYHNSIMADQMAGQWYLKACDLGQSPSDRVMIVSSCRLGNLVAMDDSNENCWCKWLETYTIFLGFPQRECAKCPQYSVQV